VTSTQATLVGRDPPRAFPASLPCRDLRVSRLRDSFLRLFFISSPFEILIQGRHIPNEINFVEVSYLKIDARVNWER
jgi:hypothetical protein